MITFALGLFLITLLSSISGSHQATCDENDFACADGTCIDSFQVCDGDQNCPDGSDETKSACPKTNIPGVGCLLPEYPDGGKYRITSGCDGADRWSPKCRELPGNLVDSNTAITFGCYNGFSLDTHIDKSICIDGTWFPRTPSCLRLCKPLESKSLIITCSYKGCPVDCTSQSVFPGTKASLKCKQFYKPSGFNYGFPICNSDGSWSESLFSCTPECGIRTNNNVTVLVSYGENASSVEYPWHAGLYSFDKKINKIELFCGGTVIAPNMILTAANCVHEMRFQPEGLHVVVGKTTRSWKIMDPGEQRFSVTKITTHHDYRGSENYYAFDIAILELSQNIVVGRLAMPACIETIPPWTPIAVGTKGTVVGWGKNELGVLSSQLMVVHLPYLDHMTCKRQAGSFRDYITHDKFCATFDSRGAGVQQSDHGGGLVFYKKELDRYFIRGIVSTKPTDRNTFATFTNISEKSHVDFIKDTRSNLRTVAPISIKEDKMTNFSRNKFACTDGTSIDSFLVCDGDQNCPDGSDETKSACPKTYIPGVGCLLPEYPDGGKYRITSGCDGADRWSPKCRELPGNLVDSNTAITFSCYNGFCLDTPINKSICIDGTWFPGTPSCLRLCKPLESKSLIITCSYKGCPVDCTSQSVFPGTKASLKCKQFYKPSGFNYGFPICNSDGSWSESLFSCTPECGIRTNNNVTVLVSYGENASSVEYPWHAGLYSFDKKINKIELFCGGTVIAPNMILTAANCVHEMRFQPEGLHVVVGKTTRSWKIMDPGEQRFSVTKITTHHDYRQSENNYAFDIAILELSENIIVGRLAMPACLETIPPWTPIAVGTKGTVVGWGKNELGVLSSQLMVVHLPYLDHMTCKRRAGSYRDFITHDKFCATFDSRGAGVQQSDSGGGLVFYKKELDRYFIRGIVSTKPTDRSTFATFTNISEKSHVNFIKDTRSNLRTVVPISIKEDKMTNFSRCPSSVGFQCGYGACIDKDRKCDGTEDCKDGSDEEDCSSSLASSGSDSPPNLVAPTSGKDCKLPDYPSAGYYQVITGCESGEEVSPKCRAQPGTPVPLNTVITYSCFKGYSLDSNISEAICYKGNWFPRTLSCLRLCMPLESKSLTINCIYKDRPVDCTSQYVLPGTKASFKCNPFYYRSGFTYGSTSTSFTTTCNSHGIWSESLFSCKPKCGIRNKNDIEALISNGNKTSAVEYPWHAGLYTFDTIISDFEVFCGGTVITPSMILTAAHCVYDLRSQPEKIKVAVGKTTRTWKIMDVGEQRFNVSKVLYHYGYSGSDLRYAFDIAILQLNQHIVIGTIAMPVCLETTHPWTIENGTMGTVVGWGKNEAGVLSQELMVAHLPYLDLHSCKEIAGPSFRDFVTRDKFCGEINPNTNALVQKGDSGGGFVFYKEKNQQYFIRGIVSTKPSDSNSFATFTNISEEIHVRFLKSFVRDE